MRYLVFILLVSAPLVAAAESTRVAEPLVPFPASELVSEEKTESTGFLVVLGALEKVNHQLQPEKSIVVPGSKESSTWYLPEARRTKQVAAHFKSELSGIADILFECRGRSCGSSSYWANKHFDRAILYGPEQYQHYLIAERTGPGEGDYIVVYIGERATRKIYVHIEYISGTDS